MESRRESSPLRITTRRLLLLIALCSLALATLRSLHQYLDGTVYSQGFNEDRFRTIQRGMTPGQVESIMGAPIWKRPQSADGKTIVWAYTTQSTATSNFWRRWVIFHDGRVESLDQQFWID